jgi:hypothetical protein
MRILEWRLPSALRPLYSLLDLLGRRSHNMLGMGIAGRWTAAASMLCELRRTHDGEWK